MKNMNERINELNNSMKLILKEFENLKESARNKKFYCATNLLSMIKDHKVMRLKFLIDIEKDFDIPSEIMQRAGAASADYSFVDGGCFQKEVDKY
jgi:hypothetical protein